MLALTPASVVEPLVAVFIYGATVVGMVVAMVMASRALGERHRERATDQVYEAGMPATGTAQDPVTVPYFGVAMLFLVFDLETAYLVAWALVAGETPGSTYAVMVFFLAVLLLVWAYVVRTGAFDWTRRTRRGREA